MSKTDSYTKCDIFSHPKKRGHLFTMLFFLYVINIQSVYGQQSIQNADIEINNAKVSTFRTYHENSVLATGNWYKIAIADDGVYKLSFDFLRSLGIDVTALNPKNLRVYGNGGTLLPQSNAAPRIDDLEENAIFVNGEADGKFDVTDAVIFYAKGAQNWQVINNEYFEHRQHIYSDSSFYFINTDLGPGKRIQSVNSLIETPTLNITTYNTYQLYEKDNFTSITREIKSGRKWFGESFSTNNSQNFSFNFPDVDIASKVLIKVAMAIRSGQNSTAAVNINSQPLLTLEAGSLPLTFETDYAREVNNMALADVSSNKIDVNITYNKPSASADAWLDYIEVNAKSLLKYNAKQLNFCNLQSTDKGNVRYVISNINDKPIILDITNLQNPKQIIYNFSGTVADFTTISNELKTFCIFSEAGLKEPKAIGKVANQNLHSLKNIDVVIVVPAVYLAEAQRLAAFRKAEQRLNIAVVLPQQIYNEFSSGSKDATAIRDFMKMLYDRGNSSENSLKYLLFFGKGSYDNRSIKYPQLNNLITYQSVNSVSPTLSYTSDDYFSLLDDQEGAFEETINSDPGKLDISTGRLPVSSAEEAKNVVDKLIAYANFKNAGNWRRKVFIIADDEDNNLHFNQAEANARLIELEADKIDVEKIYFDAYTQQQSAGSSRYPDVKKAINDAVTKGALMLNYTGHGGEDGWAEERVLAEEDILNWQNKKYLPILFTATCSFSRWDDPEEISAGVKALVMPNNGAAALFSTTRIVFASYNFDLNQSFLRAMFDKAYADKITTLGDIYKRAKNDNAGGLNINSRNFSLLGDPSAIFPLAAKRIILSAINGKTNFTDTLKALEKVKINGFIADEQNNQLSNFDGKINITVFDKPTKFKTLAQDASSFQQEFLQQRNIIYSGTATVKKGLFETTFIVPKDINLSAGKGKFAFYAYSENSDASGEEKNVTIGGITNSTIEQKGPQIATFLNDSKFKDGGITNNNPLLLINLKDESGINTSGIGIGHDLTGRLTDENGKEQIILLNDFYTAKEDTYREGNVVYLLNNLQPGTYTLTIKAWDVYNNSSEKTITFTVKADNEFAISKTYAYPNPFIHSTTFRFEHNKPNQQLDIEIEVFNLSGKRVKTLSKSVFTAGNVFDEISWDAKSDGNEKINSGVYIYSIKIRSALSGETVIKSGKLNIL